jgi:hypothetical protein
MTNDSISVRQNILDIYFNFLELSIVHKGYILCILMVKNNDDNY